MEYEFRFPDVGEGIQEGTILEWKIQTGGKVSEGQIIVVVETDKVVAELPSPRDGTLLRQGAEKGQVVRVGQVLAVIGQEQLVPEQEILQDSASVVGRLSDRPAEVLPFTGEGLPGYIDARTVSPEPSIISSPKVRATPVARRLASNFKINLDRVKGTGPGGRIMKEDILKTSGSNGGSAGKDEPPGGVPPTGIETDRDPASSPFGRRGLTALRRTIAANMTQSQQVPAAAVHDYVPIDELVKIRSSLNRESETERLGFMAFSSSSRPSLSESFGCSTRPFIPSEREKRSRFTRASTSELPWTAKTV